VCCGRKKVFPQCFQAAAASEKSFHRKTIYCFLLINFFIGFNMCVQRQSESFKAGGKFMAQNRS
jgi:hypothetical protein